MVVLNHSKYWKLGSPLQNMRVVQGTFSAPTLMTELQEAVARLYFTLPIKAASETRSAHMFWGDLAPFLTYHVNHPSSSTSKKMLPLVPPCTHVLVMADFIKSTYTTGNVLITALQMYGNVSHLARAGTEEKKPNIRNGVISSHSRDRKSVV